MPSSVADLTITARLQLAGVVPWGTPVPFAGPGVYAIALDRDPRLTQAATQRCPISSAAVEQLLSVRAELTLDGVRPGLEELASRIASFWMADETVLYVGLAGTTVAGRVRQYYNTPLGARRPHAGGWFLKTLSSSPPLWVHWAPTDEPDRAESQMLGAFAASVSVPARAALPDPDHPMPFANLEWPQGVRKRHGIRGAREPSMPAERPGATHIQPASPVPVPSNGASLPRPAGAWMRSQPVTANDRASGQVRIPHATKALFPPHTDRVRVVLCGVETVAHWNPRMGPDKERSGILRAGKVVAERVPVGTILVVSRRGKGVVDLSLGTA